MPAKTPPPPAPAPTEIVERPTAGIARGVWEAPPTFFYLLGGAVCLVAIGYVLARRGLLKRLRSRFFPGFKGSS
ncbi:MAG: hypothetical protein ABI461_21100 [Polyangiaceae bacterium]